MKNARSTCTALLLFLLLATLCTVAAWAAPGGAVIPLWRTPKPLQNIVTVAKSGGDFTDPQAAMASITDASADNPYMIYIAPGVYTLTRPLVMKENVDVRGSGRNVTLLQGKLDGTATGIIQLANASVLASLSVLNNGTGENNAAIVVNALAENANVPTLEDVEVGATGATSNYGLYGKDSSLQLTDTTIEVEGGMNSCGIFLANQTGTKKFLLLLRGGISATSATATNTGLVLRDTSLEVDSATITAQDAAEHLAIQLEEYNAADMSVWIKNSELKAGDGTNDTSNCVMYTSGAIDLKIQNSELLASPAINSNGDRDSLAAHLTGSGAFFSGNSTISGESGSVQVTGEKSYTFDITDSLLSGDLTSTQSITIVRTTINGKVSADASSGQNMTFSHSLISVVSASGEGNLSISNCQLGPLFIEGTVSNRSCTNSSGSLLVGLSYDSGMLQEDCTLL